LPLSHLREQYNQHVILWITAKNQRFQRLRFDFKTGYDRLNKLAGIRPAGRLFENQIWGMQMTHQEKLRVELENMFLEECYGRLPGTARKIVERHPDFDGVSYGVRRQAEEDLEAVNTLINRLDARGVVNWKA
jgi:hypothetical protein